MRALLFSIALLALLTSCRKKVRQPVDHTLFEPGVVLATIMDESLVETSGLVASIANPTLLWTHNDSGDTARLMLMDQTGTLTATVWLKGITNRDWEAIAIGPGPDSTKNYLYIGEIGDNKAQHQLKYIYRIEEPRISTTDTVITNVDAIAFQYPDTPRDAEALMVDPLTRDIFIISKREETPVVYRLPYPQQTGSTLTAQIVINELRLPLADRDTMNTGSEKTVNGYHYLYYYQVVGADISPDGSEMLVKSYSAVYYWKRKRGETVPEMLKRKPRALPYVPELQSEAIAFDAQGKGYYTLNERMKVNEQRLVFFKRK